MLFTSDEIQLLDDGLWCYLEEGIIDPDDNPRIESLRKKVTSTFRPVS